MKNNGSKCDLGADRVNQPTNDGYKSLGTSNDALKSDHGPIKVVEMASTQHEQIEQVDANSSMGGVETVGEGWNTKVPTTSAIESLWEQSHVSPTSNDQSSFATSVKFDVSNLTDKASCSYPVPNEVVKSSIMECDPFVDRVTESDDEVYENYDDINNYSSRSNINSGSLGDFKVKDAKRNSYMTCHLFYFVFFVGRQLCLACLWLLVAHAVHVSYKNGLSFLYSG